MYDKDKSGLYYQPVDNIGDDLREIVWAIEQEVQVQPQDYKGCHAGDEDEHKQGVTN